MKKHEEISEILKSQIEELSKLNYNDLKVFPEYSDNMVTIAGKDACVAIWKKQLDGEIQIVVQVYIEWFLSIGTMVADGFIKRIDGVIRKLPEDTRLEYC